MYLILNTPDLIPRDDRVNILRDERVMPTPSGSGGWDHRPQTTLYHHTHGGDPDFPYTTHTCCLLNPTFHILLASEGWGTGV